MAVNPDGKRQTVVDLTGDVDERSGAEKQIQEANCFRICVTSVYPTPTNTSSESSERLRGETSPNRAVNLLLV